MPILSFPTHCSRVLPTFGLQKLNLTFGRKEKKKDDSSDQLTCDFNTMKDFLATTFTFVHQTPEEFVPAPTSITKPETAAQGVLTRDFAQSKPENLSTSPNINLRDAPRSPIVIPTTFDYANPPLPHDTHGTKAWKDLDACVQAHTIESCSSTHPEPAPAEAVSSIDDGIISRPSSHESNVSFQTAHGSLETKRPATRQSSKDHSLRTLFLHHRRGSAITAASVVSEPSTPSERWASWEREHPRHSFDSVEVAAELRCTFSLVRERMSTLTNIEEVEGFELQTRADATECESEPLAKGPFVRVDVPLEEMNRCHWRDSLDTHKARRPHGAKELRRNKSFAAGLLRLKTPSQLFNRTRPWK